MAFRGLLLSCSECGRPIEAVVYSQRALEDGFRGHWPFADSHEREYGHYPNRVHLMQTRGRMPLRGRD